MARTKSATKTKPIPKTKTKPSKRSNSSSSGGPPSSIRKRPSATPSSKANTTTATVTPSSKKIKANKDKESNGGGGGDKHKSISSRPTRSKKVPSPSPSSSPVTTEEQNEGDSDPDPTDSEPEDQVITTSTESKSKESSRRKHSVAADDSLTNEIQKLLLSKGAKERAKLLQTLQEIHEQQGKNIGKITLADIEVEDEDMDEDGDEGDNGSDDHSAENEGEDKDETMSEEQEYKRKKEEYIAKADEAVDKFAAAFEERHHDHILSLKTSSTKTVDDYKSAMATYANDGIINHARKYLQALMNEGNIAVDKWDALKERLNQHGTKIRGLFVKLDACDQEIERMVGDVKEQWGDLFDRHEARREECKSHLETEKEKYRRSYAKATDAERIQKEININLKETFEKGSR